MSKQVTVPVNNQPRNKGKFMSKKRFDHLGKRQNDIAKARCNQ